MEASPEQPMGIPMSNEEAVVGSEYRYAADQAMEALPEPLRHKVSAAADRYNCIAKPFQSEFMEITGFTEQNIASQIDKTSMEIDGLLCAYGFPPGIATGLRILHSDDSTCDVIVELVESQIFGAVSYYCDEPDIAVYQSHRVIQGTVYQTSNGKCRVYILSGEEF